MSWPAVLAGENGAMSLSFERTQSVAIIGGGPGGYEAALAAAQLGAEVTVVERAGIGGSAVITDVVPSKTLIATADAAVAISEAGDLGVQLFAKRQGGQAAQARDRDQPRRGQQAPPRRSRGSSPTTCAPRSSRPASGSSRATAGSRATTPSSSRPGPKRHRLRPHRGRHPRRLSTGSSPRELPSAKPDGERILTWTQLYDMTSLPEHLIVVGSGVTGAEFASAYMNLGAKVTLVSSREQVLPGEDKDAA